MKFPSRVLESPWKVLEFLAWKSVRTLSLIHWSQNGKFLTYMYKGLLGKKKMGFYKYRFSAVHTGKVIRVMMSRINSMFTEETFCNPYWVCLTSKWSRAKTASLQKNWTVLKYLLMHCLINRIADTFKLLYKPFVEVWIKRHTLWLKPNEYKYSSLYIDGNSMPPVIALTYSKNSISG